MNLRRLGFFLTLLLVLLACAGTVGFLVWQAWEPEVVFETAKPERADIVKKTVATGALVPRNEIELKSRVSGILEELLVEPGETVEKGDLVARIRVVPDPRTLERAASAVRIARLNLEEAEKVLEEETRLVETRALPEREVVVRRVEVARLREELRAADAELTLVRDGAMRNAASVATEIRSTVEGMILAVPVKVGESVTETNTFNAGTTIASVADMRDMIFLGKVDESEVGRIREGMPLDIMVGALDNARLNGTLEYISPKGVLQDGAVQFEIKAALAAREGLFVRAGSSANADIVLDRRDQVLAVSESLLRFDPEGPYVEVEVGKQVFEKRRVKTGLSDGLMIEVVDGLSEGEVIKGKAKEAGDSGGGPRGPRRRG
jgi:HlyD family secretion protein